MEQLVKGERKNRWIASRDWYATALAIILWAIFQEVVMASTDIVDNIFANLMKVNQVKGLSEFNNEIINSKWSTLTIQELIDAGLSSTYTSIGNGYNAGQITVNGVTASNQIYLIMFSMVSGFCYGCGIYSAQYFGARDYNKLRQVTALKMYVVFIITGIFALMTIPGITEHLIKFTTSPKYATMPLSDLEIDNSSENIQAWFNYIQYRAAMLSTYQGEIYYRVIGTSYLIFVINETAITSLRETRRPMISFWISLIALVGNIIMNTFFGLYTNLGVIGFAISTYISRILQMSFIIILFSFKKYEFIPRYNSFYIEKNVYKSSLFKALPILLNELLFAFSAVLQVKLKGMYSFEALTANAIYATITFAIFSPIYHGLNAGITVFVGNSLGANKIEEAEKNSRYLFGLGMSIAIFASILLVGLSFFVPTLLFSEANAESQRIAFWMLIIYAFIYPTIMIANASYSILRAGGSVWDATLLDGVFNWTIPIPLLTILILLNTNGIINLDIIWIHLIVLLCEIPKAVWSIYIYNKKRWLNNLNINNKQVKNNIKILEI